MYWDFQICLFSVWLQKEMLAKVSEIRPPSAEICAVISFYRNMVNISSVIHLIPYILAPTILHHETDMSIGQSSFHPLPVDCNYYVFERFRNVSVYLFYLKFIIVSFPVELYGVALEGIYFLGGSVYGRRDM